MTGRGLGVRRLGGVWWKVPTRGCCLKVEIGPSEAIPMRRSSSMTKVSKDLQAVRAHTGFSLADSSQLLAESKTAASAISYFDEKVSEIGKFASAVSKVLGRLRSDKQRWWLRDFFLYTPNPGSTRDDFINGWRSIEPSFRAFINRVTKPDFSSLVNFRWLAETCGSAESAHDFLLTNVWRAVEQTHLLPRTYSRLDALKEDPFKELRALKGKRQQNGVIDFWR
jgi:hypothetical protein